MRPGHAPAVRRIDQVIPTLASRDAIGQHTTAARQVLREMGFVSDIFYANASADVLRDGRPLEELGDEDPTGRWLLYQLSIGSPAGEVFAKRPEPKLVDYHNITPAELLRAWEPSVAEELRLGRSQLVRLAPVTRFAMADSAFNEQELRSAGYGATAVAPLMIDLEALAGSPDPVVAARLLRARAEGGTGLLFVGKVAPHKAQHDLLKALAVYRRLYDPRARLRIVGGAIGDAYPEALARFASMLGVDDAVEMVGSVPHAELVAYYEGSDVFVCLSDHEGFCVPLLEAMMHRLPIVAFGAAAVPDTVGDAGLVLPDKQALRVAAAVDRVVRDESLRAAMADAAADQVAQLSLGPSRAAFRGVIEQALAAPAQSAPAQSAPAQSAQ